VEDNPADAGLVREALKEHGVEGELIVVTDGEQAIEFIQEMESNPMTRPDLFIVDLNLPKRPGREVLERLRQGVTSRQAPVVILTSSDESRDRDEARRLGISQYILKPSRLAEFLALGAIFKEMIIVGRGPALP
jgi:chemotaxis family two-component system response regulator Rcp1